MWAALARAIAADRRAGKMPLAIVGNAGTTGTGAIDDMNALADLAERERLHFHVDGRSAPVPRCHRACGRRSPAWSAPTRSPSICTVDVPALRGRLHPGEGRGGATRGFQVRGVVFERMERGLAAGDVQHFSEYGPQLSRASGL